MELDMSLISKKVFKIKILFLNDQGQFFKHLKSNN